MPTPVVIQAPFYSHGGNDWSTYVKQITLTYEVDEKEVTTGGETTFISYPGLYRWRLAGQLQQSYLDSGLDDVMFAYIGDTTAQAIVLRPDDAVVGVNNPSYSGNGYLMKWPPIAGAIGDVYNVDFEVAAAGALTRAEA